VEEILFHWSGQTMEPVDCLGYIGRNPMDADNVFIVTGESGMGLTHSSIAGMLLTDLIIGRPNPWEKLYSPSRVTFKAATRFARENLDVAGGLGQWLTPGEVKSVEEIAPDTGAILRLVQLGVPIGLTIFLEFSLFSVVALLVGRLGVEAVAAHQIAINIGGITFMIPMALGIAVSIRVGFNVGRRDLVAARRSGRVAIGVSLAVAVIAALLLLGLREAIAGLYTTDPAVLLLSADLLLFVAIWQLVDDAQVTTIGVLRGFKDTRVPMLVALLAYWAVGLPIGVMFGFGWVEVPALQGLRGFWVGFCVALLVAAVVLLGRFAWLSRRDDRILAFANR